MAFNPAKFVIGAALIIGGVIGKNPNLILAGVSLVGSAVNPLAAQNRTSQATTIDPQNKVPVLYGKAKAGLKLIDARAHDGGSESPANDFLLMPGAVCHGSQNGEGIEAFHEVFIDGLLAADDGWGPPYLRIDGGLILGAPQIEPHFIDGFDLGGYLGTATQTVPAVMHQQFPTAWPTTSRVRGIAYLIGRYESDSELYAGRPEMRVIASGAKLYDPRTGLYAWSDNPALAIYDMLTSPIYGAGIPAARIDDVSFEIAADYCDELLGVPDDAGGTRNQKRFTCNGLVATEAPLQRRFEMLLSACHGNLIWQSGKFRLQVRRDVEAANLITAPEDLTAGGWSASSVTITANDTTAPKPNATATADLVDDQSGAAAGRVGWSETISNDTGERIFVAYVKKQASSHTALLRLTYTGGTVLDYRVEIDVSDGTVSVAGSPDTPSAFGSAEAFHDPDWYRVWVAGPNNGTGNTAVTGQVYPATDITLAAGDTGSVHYWGLELKRGVTPGNYFNNLPVISEDTIIGNFKWRAPGIRDGGNAAVASFVNPEEEYMVDTVQWPEVGSQLEADWIAEDKNRIAPYAFDLPYTDDKYMATQLAATTIAELRESDTFYCVAPEPWLEQEVGNLVTVDHGVIDSIGPVKAWIIGMGLAASDTGGVALELMRYNAAAYDVPVAGGGLTEIGPTPDPALPDPTTPNLPTGLAITATFACHSPTQGQIALNVSWTLSGAANSAVEVEWAEGASPTTWRTTPRLPKGSTSTTVFIPDPQASTYSVRIREIGFYGNLSEWVSTTVDLTTRTGPDASAITAPDTTITNENGVLRLDVDTTGSNGTIFDLHASATSSFTPMPANRVATVFAELDDTISFFFIPPGVGPGGTFYFKIVVKDCLSDVIGDEDTTAEESGIWNGPTGLAQAFAYVDLGDVTGTTDIDWAAGWMYRLRMTGDTTLTFSGYAAGMALWLRVEDDGVGRTLTFPANEWSPNGTDPGGPATGEVNTYTFQAEGATLADVSGQLMGVDYS